MAKSHGNRGKTIEFRKNQYIDPKIELTLEESINGIAKYSLQNVSKPFKKGILYQNGIELLSQQRIQLLTINHLCPYQIPFIIGGKDKDKGMIGILTCDDITYEEAYLSLVGVYLTNSSLKEQLKKEKSILTNNILSSLGFDYEITGPKVNLELIGMRNDIFLNPNDNLEGRIISNISPLIGYEFRIKEETDQETNELILSELNEKKEELKYAFAS